MPYDSKSLTTLPKKFSIWFKANKWQPRTHQLEMLAAAQGGNSTLLIAPTGSGKTLAGFLPTLVELFDQPQTGLHTIYISPLKALTADIERNLIRPIEEMKLPISVETRTGDTSSHRRQRQIKKPPNILLTTPESLELILSYAEAGNMMKGLKRIIIDEVHALAPGKRGHLTALCIARLKSFSRHITITGLSATVAEPEQFALWLDEKTQIIKAEDAAPPKIKLLTKKRVPWSGYMGNYAITDIYEAVQEAKTTIIFVNTRAQAELVFQRLWEVNEKNLPIALHHGSLEKEHRLKVEARMSEGTLRAIIATASLDLGLDWGSVDQVIQIGAPKGISRLLQRIGRSNHRLDEPSKALLVPCNRFEMIECIAVMDAIKNKKIDGDKLHPGTLDVLAQFVMNCAASQPFDIEELYAQVIKCHSYKNITREKFNDIVQFVSDGGYSLKVYDRFKRIFLNEENKWEANPVAVRRHRQNIGTIVEYETLKVTVKRKRGGKGRDLGRIEDYFIQGLMLGDTFLFAGQMLKYNGIKDNKVEVEYSKAERPKIPSFKGGKLPFSPSLAEQVRKLIENPTLWSHLPEALRTWLEFQREISILPSNDYLLTESYPHEGLNYFIIYSFAGRNANQTLGMLMSYQMEQQGLKPLGFVANDYAVAHWGINFVTKSDKLISDALAEKNSSEWINNSQMSKRAFREVAIISGLVERSDRGKRKTGKQVTISTDLIYDVLRKYEPNHILLQATKTDVEGRLTDIERLHDVISGLPVKHIVLEKVSPLSVPMILDLGVEKIKGGAGEISLLDSASRDKRGDALFKEATS